MIESDDEEEFEDHYEDDMNQEEQYQEDEDDARYFKEEGSKVRYAPLRGNQANDPPCDACVRRRKPCYPQGSEKSRGACYECGRLKTKCIFSVSYYFLQYIFKKYLHVF